MKSLSTRRRYLTFTAVVGIGLVVTSFQNCGKAGFDSGTEVSLSSEGFDAANRAEYGVAAAEKLSQMPFSFDASFDLISTMSCNNGQIKTPQPHLYTMKAGAYGPKAGLRVKSANSFSNYDYKKYVRDNFTPINNTAFTLDEYRSYLTDSSANNGAVAVAGLRQPNDYSVKYEQYPFVELGGPVSDPAILESVMSTYDSSLKTNDYNLSTSYFPFSNNKEKRFEVVFNFLADFTGTGGTSNGVGRVGDFFRSTEAQENYLTLAFKPREAANASDLVAPTLSGNRVVGSDAGVKYQLSFKPAIGGGQTSLALFRNVIESSMSANGGVDAPWNCESGIQTTVRDADMPRSLPINFMIVDDTDANNRATCLYETDSEMARYRDPQYAKVLALAKKHLSTEHWYMNLHYNASDGNYSNCAYKKVIGASCYDTTSGTSRRGNGKVDYSLSKPCYNPPMYGDGDTGNCQGKPPITIRQFSSQTDIDNNMTDEEFLWAGEGVTRKGIRADGCGVWQCAQFVSFCARDNN